MQVIFNDWRFLAVAVAGFLLLVLILSGKGTEVLQAVVEAIRAWRQPSSIERRPDTPAELEPQERREQEQQ